MTNASKKSFVDELDVDLAQLLDDLSTVQHDLLDVLSEKRERIAANDLQGLGSLNARATELCAQLEECQHRRQELLATVEQRGVPAGSLGKLAAMMTPETGVGLGKQAKELGSRMRLLQHQCLANWVVAQRTLLHVSQLLEIIASGGRIQPTYGTGAASLSRGSLIDSEA